MIEVRIDMILGILLEDVFGVILNVIMVNVVRKLLLAWLTPASILMWSTRWSSSRSTMLLCSFSRRRR